MDFTQILISFILFIFIYVETPCNSVHLFSSFLSFLFSLSEEYMFYIYKSNFSSKF